MDPVEFTVDHSLYIEVKLPEGVAVTGKLMSIEVTVYSYLLEVVTVIVRFVFEWLNGK